MPRAPLVPVPPNVLSCYKEKAGGWRPLASFKEGGRMTPDAAAAIGALTSEVKVQFGVDLLVSDAWRSAAQSAASRARYDNWVAFDKPERSSPAWDSKTMKDAFVAQPGRSWHNGGRANDWVIEKFILDSLASHKLDFTRRSVQLIWNDFRNLVRGIGWLPITKDEAGPFQWSPDGTVKKQPDGSIMLVSEAWHHEFRGEWGTLCDGSPPDVGYEQSAMGAFLDVADAGERMVLTKADTRELQANLNRAGLDAGPVDGDLGSRTRRAAAAVGLPLKDMTVALAASQALPSRR
jgi:hypothetical protein